MASMLALPIVRLTVEMLKQPESAAWAAARTQVLEVLKEHGCLEVIYDGITPKLREATINAVKEVVSLPVETKRRNKAGDAGRGYIGQSSGFDYESLAIGNVPHRSMARGFTDLLWPEGNDRFCDAVCNFAEEAAAVEAALRRMVLESLGVEKYYGFHMGLTKYLLRLSEYTPVGLEGEAKLVLPPHTDSSVTTLSLQSDVHGLEVKTTDGDWMAVAPSSPCSLVFIIGDVFRAWSNGLLYAPPHRVRVHTGAIRQVAVLFAVPKDDPVIEIPPELVDDEKSPAQFKPFRFSEYMEFFASRIVAAGDDAGSILPAFCGTGAAEPKSQA